jgi:hypothetical protein
MAKKYNDIALSEIEDRYEQKWFSFLKQSARDLNFGSISLEMTVRGGKIVNIKNIKVIENFNINS